MRRTCVSHLSSGALFGVPVLALAMLVGQGPAAAYAQDTPSTETPSSGGAAPSQDTGGAAPSAPSAEPGAPSAGPSAPASEPSAPSSEPKADGPTQGPDLNQPDKAEASKDAPASDAAKATDAPKTDSDDADRPKGDRPDADRRDRDRGDARDSDRGRRDADRRSDDRRRRADDDDDRMRDDDRRDRNRDRGRDRDRDQGDDDRADRRDRDDRRFSRDFDDDRRGDRRDRSRLTRFGVFFSVGGDGLIVTRIAPRTIAARVGLLADDVIVSVNGHRIRTEAEFTRWLFAEPDDRVTIIILRDGREHTLYVDADDLDDLIVVREEESVMVEHDVDLGIVIDDSVADAAIVLEVHRNSPADEVGVREGDRIVKINGQRINSPDRYHQVVGNLRPGDDVELEFGQRDTEVVTLRLDAGERDVYVEDEDVDVRVRESGPDVRIREREPVRVEGEVEIEGGRVEGSGTIRTEPRRRGILRPRIFNRR